MTVFLVRKNPFKYTYTSAVNVEVIDQTSLISSFLSLFPIGPVLSTFSEKGAQDTIDDQNKSAKQPVTPPTPATILVCRGEEANLLQRLRDELEPEIQRAERLKSQISSTISDFQRLSATAQSFSNTAEQAVTSVSSCQALENEANTARTDLSSFVVGTIPKESTEHLRKVSRIKEVIEFFQPRDPACIADRQALHLLAFGLEKQAEELAGKAEDLKKGKQAFDQKVKTIERALSQNPFYETRDLRGRGRLPSKATITTTRKPNQPTDAKPEPAHTVEVRFGDPFFSLSAGFGIADMRDAEFGKEKGIGFDENNDTVEVERLVATSESDPTPLGAVQLNANFIRLFKKNVKRDVMFAMSLGVSARDGDENSDFGYYFGPSLGFLDSSLYFTIGYHLRESQVLGGGFVEGEPITVELDEIPTRNRTEESFIFVASYKIR